MAQTPLQPLSIGNAVSAAFRLYRDRLSAYFGIALRATCWLLIPILALIPIPLTFLSGQPNFAVLAILGLVGFFLLLFGIAKYTTNVALISRLAFGTLANQPETVQEASSHVIPKTWSFLGADCLIFLIIAGAYLGFFLVIFMMSIFSSLFANSLSGSWQIAWILILLAIVLLVIMFSLLIRFIIRFSIIEVPLAIENSSSATRSVIRTWKLTEGNVNRIFWILIVAGLITLPVQIISTIISNILKGILIAILPADAASSSGFLGLIFLINYALGVILSVFLIPFWQAIKAAIYYDLRTRKEGLDLQLRKRPL